MRTDLTQVQKKLWDAADELRANSGLQASEYSGPVLGLIFLRFAEERFAAVQRYWDAEPTPHVGELLDEIDADRSCIFWG